jgi:predicted DNA-binding protein (UPF0278 family)
MEWNENGMSEWVYNEASRHGLREKEGEGDYLQGMQGVLSLILSTHYTYMGIQFYLPSAGWISLMCYMCNYTSARCGLVGEGK